MKTEIAALLVANLNDIRLANARLSLNDLIERPDFDVSISKYRLKAIATEAEIKTVDELLLLITEDKINIYPHSGNNASFSDKVNPIRVELTGVSVNLIPGIDSDSNLLFNSSSAANRISFIMNYAGDLDSVLPLKIIGMILTRG